MKIISFFLPQFHPIPENDFWWGKGFTEWTNVVKAKPRYNNHYQPHIPSELGFYDLRTSETRIDQEKLAFENGLHGFCYYHYWFNGKLVLERPLNEKLKSEEQKLPFCICWANENWTRAWDGQEKNILLEQTYSKNDAIDHINHLVKIISSKIYITIHDKPLILIYRPDLIPDSKNYFKIWREEATKNGLKGLHIAGVQSGLVKLSNEQIIECGFDSVIDFQPNREYFPTFSSPKRVLIEFLRRILPNEVFQLIKNNANTMNKIDYEKMVKIVKNSYNTKKNYTFFPTIFPSWDNTARRKTPTIIENDDENLFYNWLHEAKVCIENRHDDEKIIFINAWNEWAEGCHLEPDKKNGRKFLKSIKRLVENSKNI